MTPTIQARLGKSDHNVIWRPLNSIKCNVQINKSVPPGEIPPVIIKEFAPEIAEPLTHIFNSSLKEGIVPKAWKQATVIPIPKKKDKQQFGNVKGISTSHYLIGLLHYLLSGLEKPGHKARILAVDFSKAFDRISHQVLISKMISIGVRKSIIPRFCSFLTCREQRVLMVALFPVGHLYFAVFRKERHLAQAFSSNGQ
ncbi:uncharacterized protein [Antedon mediterranea]|uniref:uncharacterized protein n=1 Tax=Antedon mediterranea TaxID=105859 RepID=UPI003AF5ED6D